MPLGPAPFLPSASVAAAGAAFDALAADFAAGAEAVAFFAGAGFAGDGFAADTDFLAETVAFFVEAMGFFAEAVGFFFESFADFEGAFDCLRGFVFAFATVDVLTTPAPPHTVAHDGPHELGVLWAKKASSVPGSWQRVKTPDTNWLQTHTLFRWLSTRNFTTHAAGISVNDPSLRNRSYRLFGSVAGFTAFNSCS